MGKIGTWSYWFKSPDGFDITSCKNKKDIPKGYKYIVSMEVYKPDGNTDDEIMVDKKVVWIKKNTNKLTKCEILNMAQEVQEKLHECLNVNYPKNAYKAIFKKKIKEMPDLKGCKIK